ncbi:endonuclease domain-containing 1 protein-like isoform X2 [Sparus aurata]|uniref:Endonuclease domain-containing 1 protein-like n=2 Tax=Sparus aurata TaxID=8175 RepID=A0A671WU02_SPAAU|nr:endonuclease domain-containing 1 protein-like isoform X2 [Sparus aurata]
MQTLVPLCALLLLLFSAQADVVAKFEDNCSEFFYHKKVPKWGESTDGAVRICQRYGEGSNSKFHFATLYDTKHRIAVYSAYVIELPMNGGQDSRLWLIEPQLVDTTWKGEMEEERILKQEHSGIDLGKKQALNEDYKESVFDRGHLNPNGHHSENHKRAATYTLTNVVPQNHKLNTEAWRKYEAKLLTKIKSCTKAFVLVGAVPSEDNWIVKNNVKSVNIPDFLWNAYCCVDNNDKPKLRGAASAKNSEDNKVNELTLDQLKEFLKIPKEAEGVLFDKDCTS